MKFLLVALSLHGFVQAQVLKQNGVSGGSPSFSSVAASTVTVTGTGSKCFSVDDPTLTVDCNSNTVMVGGSLGGIADADPLKVVATDGGARGTGIFWGPNNVAYGGRLTYDQGTGFIKIDNNHDSAAARTDFRMRTQGTSVTAMSILGSGYVGFGTPTPATTLDVNGNAQFGTTAKSTFTADGNLLVPGNISIFGGGYFDMYGAAPNTYKLAYNQLNLSANGTINAQGGTLYLNNNGGPIVFGVTASPASNAACVAGTISWDATYLYLCTASGVVKRATMTGGY